MFRRPGRRDIGGISTKFFARGKLTQLHRKPRHLEKKEYQSRRIILQRRLKQALIALAVIFVLWMFIGGDMGLWTMWQSVRYEKKLEKIVLREEKHSNELDEKIRKLQSDTLFIEQVARTNLGMVKDNEKVFVFPKNFGEDKK